MLAAMHNGEHDHVRTLLDHRTQRADIPPPHSRYSAFSDRSDSPSLYSNYVRNTPATPASRFPIITEHAPSDDHYLFPTTLRDRFDDPNASTLDLSEDLQSEGSHATNLDDDGHIITDDADSETRLSLLGPKMRVHSRAPWETGEDEDENADNDDSGMDNLSIFGGKKSGRSVIRGLGFGTSKATTQRPSLESTSKGKRSFDTTSSTMGSGSHSALHALAQASVSTTSLALGSSQSSASMSHKLSMPRLPLSRNRTTSVTSSSSEKHPPPLPSPRSVLYTERESGRHSPHSPYFRGQSPTRSDNSSRVQSPQLDTREGSATYVHPYANPALLSASERDSLIDPFGNRDSSEQQREPTRIVRNDSSGTISASEETIVLSHSVSTYLTSASESSMVNSCTSTSAFSLTSVTPSVNPLRPPVETSELDAEKQQRKARRETKLGPISAPTKLTRGEISVSSPYNLISLQEAQALAKDRSRGLVGIPAKDVEIAPPLSASAIESRMGGTFHSGEWNLASRLRTVSAGAYSKHSTASDETKPPGMSTAPGTRAPCSASAGQMGVLPSPVGAGKTLKNKRSGFMKLFNGREKEKPLVITHPLPTVGNASVQRQGSEASSKPPPSPIAPPKITSHRVPVPVLGHATPSNTDLGRQQRGKGEFPAAKRPIPALSIKVSAPFAGPQSTGSSTVVLDSRRSDSPNQSLPQHLRPPLPPASAPPGTTQFATLSLRPVSAFFSETFSDHLIQKDNTPALTSPTSLTTDSSSSSPMSGTFTKSTSATSDIMTKLVERSYSEGGDIPRADDPTFVISALQDQLRESRKAWQRQIWELEGQVRDLKTELEELRSGDKCEACGRGIILQKAASVTGVVHRPRAKTGTGARFASAIDTDRA